MDDRRPHPAVRVIADDLWFPEGPVWVGDGTLLVVEIRRKTLTRIWPDGRKAIVANLGGGPNGAAIGPDGCCYVVNNGGFTFAQRADGCWVTAGTPDDYVTGRIERVDIDTGKFEVLYDRIGDRKIGGPNDLVFDAHGGFYFTDHGTVDDEARIHRIAGIYYARADGSAIEEVVYPSDDPNGIGLSPDGSKLYWAETWRGRILQRDVVAPGTLAEPAPADPSVCLHGFPGLQLLDSLAVDAAGNVCVATIVNGGVSVVSPAGELVDFVPTGDLITTNVCFGGDDLTTAYITLSSTGRLVKTTWPRPGLQLAHAAAN